MTTALPPAQKHDAPAERIFLLVGIVLATLAEAITSTALSLGRNDIIGDTHATPDEFAWLDVGYTSLKLVAFMASPWGILLVSGQTIIFLAWPHRRQPFLQALFAMGSVVAPATIAPAFQGWLLDSQSWTWIFLSAVPMAMVAAGLVLMADDSASIRAVRRPFDWADFLLISATLFCFAYILSRGSRWDWFEEERIVWLTLAGTSALMVFIAREISAGRDGLLDFTAFRSTDFTFAFIVSFVAGAALFGSAYLIPSFVMSVLSFSPTDAGLLLLPSGLLFVLSLFVCAFLMQACRVSPIATVPFGIVMIMVAMWMLSGSTRESGTDDLMAAILLRGFSLGFLFLSITLIAFSGLERGSVASGIGLFNAGRQLGGLVGVAALQTLIQHDVAANATVLASHVTAGIPAVGVRLGETTAALTAGGMDSMDASRGALGLVGKAVIGQSTVIAFDTAFNAVALLFIAAAPALIIIRVAAARLVKGRA